MQRTVIIGPNKVWTENTRGRVFIIHSATAQVDVEIENRGKITMSTGGKVGGPGDEPFSRVRLWERSGATVTVRFEISDRDVSVNVPAFASQTTTAKDPSTYTKATVCNANATTTFNGLDGALQRKQIIVNNREAVGGQVITVSDDTGAVTLQLDPREKLTLVTNGVLKVAVPAGAQPAAVLETFYST